MDEHYASAAKVIVDDIARRLDARQNTMKCELAAMLCAFPDARLHCNHCANEIRLTIAKTLEYLDYGWPLCCGETYDVRCGKAEN